MTTYAGTKEFEGATLVRSSFKGATVRFSDINGATMRGVDVDGLDIDSHDLFFGSLVVNGVDVVPLVDAELILRMQQPFHEIGQIFTGAADLGFDMSIFRVDPPAYAEILGARADRQSHLRYIRRDLARLERT